VQAFSSLEEVANLSLHNLKTKQDQPFLKEVLKYASDNRSTNDGELASFVAYACAFPHNCLCLIDTYDTLESGLQNFLFVAKALDDFGYQPKGVRLDSGDLAKLSSQCQEAFRTVVLNEPSRQAAFGNLSIVASNDLDEKILVELSTKTHGITSFGIGTNLVTCASQPALGCVSDRLTLHSFTEFKAISLNRRIFHSGLQTGGMERLSTHQVVGRLAQGDHSWTEACISVVWKGWKGSCRLSCFVQ
jgi:nicotinate phosphoribosyltransferase